MVEIFKDIPEYEGLYQASNLGNIKSLHSSQEKTLKKVTDSYGYHIVRLSKNGKSKNKKVHRLIYLTFIGVKKHKHNEVIDHINNNKKDNRIDNLQSITIRENTTKDRFRKNRSSKYLGVYFHKKANKWHTQIYINGKKKHIGYFKTEIEAHKAYKNTLLSDK